MKAPHYLEIRIPWQQMTEMSDSDAHKIDDLIAKGQEMGWITATSRQDVEDSEGFCTIIRIWGDFSAIRQLLPEASSE